MSFSLLTNAFAILDATSRTPIAELPGLAERDGTAAAAAALRALSVPRSRLGAEVAFLPGAAEATPGLLAGLRRGERPEPGGLPQAAKANLLAHLCAAAGATDADQAGLVAAQSAPGDATLAAEIDADRRAAGVPALQPGALAAEQDALANQHAAALVGACLAGPDPAARLAALVRTAPDGAPASFMRRVASVWTRQSAAELARFEEAAAAAEAATVRAPDLAACDRLAAAIRVWAGSTQPQRLSDARAGLDHGPTLRVLRSWRQTGIRLANNGHPELALPLARTLSDCFADLPGESAQLAEDVRACAGLVETQTLEPRLAPLRSLAERLAAAPAQLEAVLAKAPFGPGAPGVAGELWAAFDGAAACCVVSEAPWTILRDLAARLGGKHKLAGAASALAIQRGLIARAETAGFDGLAVRLRAQQRGLERAAAIWRYVELADKLKRPWGGGPTRRRRVLAALRQALPLVDDPNERATLEADERKLVRQGRNAWIGYAALVGSAVMLALVAELDHSYSEDAPYRHAAPVAIASAPRAGVADPVPYAGPAPAPAPPPVLNDAPPNLPKMPPVTEAAPDLVKEPSPKLLLAFPARTVLPERQPRNSAGVRTLAEIRWCLFNEVRLNSAFEAADPAQADDVRALGQVWRELCDSYDAHRRDADQATSEAKRDHARLQTEGRAMLLSGPAR